MTKGSTPIYYSVSLKRQVVREYESGHFSKSDFDFKQETVGYPSVSDRFVRYFKAFYLPTVNICTTSFLPLASIKIMC
jgi:hypothetical protein